MTRPLINPLPNSRITGTFGDRPSIDLDGDGRGDTAGKHEGLDLASGRRSPVFAAADGIVVPNRYSLTSAGPHAVTIAHPSLVLAGIAATGYAHLDARTVAMGAKVKAGQLIGYEGSRGMATGRHLHLDVFSDLPAFRRIDPQPLIDFTPPTIKETAMAETRLYRRTSTGTTIIANVREQLLWYVPNGDYITIAQQIPGVLDSTEIVELSDPHFRLLVQLAIEGHSGAEASRVLDLALA